MIVIVFAKCDEPVDYDIDVYTILSTLAGCYSNHIYRI